MTETMNPVDHSDDGTPLGALSVPQLLRNLATLEDSLRGLPPLVAVRGRLVINPERRRLVARQQAVVKHLRSRRATLRSHQQSAPALGRRVGAGAAAPGRLASERSDHVR